MQMLVYMISVCIYFILTQAHSHLSGVQICNMKQPEINCTFKPSSRYNLICDIYNKTHILIVWKTQVHSFQLLFKQHNATVNTSLQTKDKPFESERKRTIDLSSDIHPDAEHGLKHLLLVLKYFCYRSMLLSLFGKEDSQYALLNNYRKILGVVYMKSAHKLIIADANGLRMLGLKDGSDKVLDIHHAPTNLAVDEERGLIIFCTRQRIMGGFTNNVYSLTFKGTLQQLGQFVNVIGQSTVIDTDSQLLFADVNGNFIISVSFNGRVKDRIVSGAMLKVLQVVSEGGIKYLYYAAGRTLYKILLKLNTRETVARFKRNVEQIITHNDTIYIIFEFLPHLYKYVAPRPPVLRYIFVDLQRPVMLTMVP